MRTIKFRGKCVHDSKYAGEWVTGGYVAPINARAHARHARIKT